MANRLARISSLKVAIIVPSGDMVHADFAMCLARLVAYSSIAGIDAMIINPKSSLVQKGRWSGVKAALQHSPDKILFIDSDQTFPANSLLRLQRHKKDIVGATCLTRRPPHEFTARDFNGNRIDFSNLTGMHQVGTNGFPLCLVDADVFKKISDPWFQVSFENGRWFSEDENFCYDARRALIPIWVDADLTKEVGHLGMKEFKCE